MAKRGLALLIFISSIFLSLFSITTSATVIVINDTSYYGVASYYIGGYSVATSVFYYGTEQTAFIYHYRGFIDFNTSAIPDNAIINDVDLNYTIETRSNSGLIYVRNLTQRAELYATGQDLYDALGSASNFTSINAFDSTGEKTIELNTAKTDLKNRLSADWFSVGVVTNETETGDDNYDTASSMELIVDYTPVTTIDSCQSLTSASTYYQLNQSVNSSGTCFTIRNNSITIDCNGFNINYSQGGLGYGVDIASGNNSATVMNCNITEGRVATSSKHGIRVTNSSNNMIFNNTITIIGGSSGIRVQTNSINDTIYNNTIMALGSSAVGISFVTASYNILSNNVITARGSSGYGINLLTTSVNNTLGNNIITTSGSTGHGIYLLTNSGNNTLTNNSLNVTGNGGYGIHIKTDYNNLNNNTVITSTSDNTFGINLELSSYNSLTGNAVNTSDSISYMIYGNSSLHFNHSIDLTNLAEGKPVNYTYNVDDLVFDGIDFTQYGEVMFSWSRNITIQNSNFSGDSLNFFYTNTSTVLNNNINSNTGNGILLYSNSSNNSVINNTVIVLSGYTHNNGIISHSGGNSNIINSNTVVTSGTLSEGIILFVNSNNTINENNVTTFGTSGYGIFIITATYTNVTNNKVTTSGNSAWAIYLLLDANSNNVMNNTVITSNSSAYGIYLASSRNTVNNNTITTSGSSGRGIFLSVSGSNSISNNFVITSGTSGHGLYFSNSNSNSMSGNIVTTSGTSGHGLYFSNSNSNSMSGNIVITSGTSSRGLFLGSSANDTLINNQINTSQSQSYLINGINISQYNHSIDSSNLAEGKPVNYTFNADNLVFDGIDFTQYGQVMFGWSRNIIIRNSNFSDDSISFLNTNDSVIENSMVDTDNGYGIYIERSNNITLTNSTVTTSGSSGNGIMLSVQLLTPSTFSGLNVKTSNSNAYPFYLGGTIFNFMISDSVLNASYSGVQELYIDSVTGGTWDFTNVTRADSTPIAVNWTSPANGTLNMMWHLNAYANYSNGTDASDVNMSSWDKNNALKFSEFTGANGRILQKNLIEYKQNGTGGVTKTYYSNYTFNATKAGYAEQSQSWNMTTNRNLVFTLTAGDTNPPSVSVNYPASLNPIESSVSTFSFNFTATDPSGLNDSTATATISKVISKTNSSCTANVIDPTTTRYDCTIGMNYYDEAGSWNINASVCDNLGNCGYNDTESFTYNQLKAFTVNTSSVNLSTFYFYDLEKTDSIALSNTGNVNVTEINVTAYDLIGQADNSYKLDSAFFSVKYDAGSYAYLINATAVTMPSASLYTYPTSPLNTVFRLEPVLLPKTLKSQAYQNNAGEEWAISI